MSWSDRIAIVAMLAGAMGTARADKAAADAAFQAGRRLMADGKIAEACPKFELSYKEDPQLGTLLNLGECHEREGKLATAWAEFKAALEFARQRKDKREDYARERKEKLDDRISRIVIRSPDGLEGLEVFLDGRDVTALVGVDVPIDPGSHAIVSRLGDGREATRKIEVTREGSRLELEVPIPRAASTPPETPEKRPEPSGGGGARKTIGLVTAGVGLVATGVGLYFGKQGFDRYEESRPFCEDNICDARGRELVDEARSLATRSNIVVGAGVAVLAVGVILWLTAPSERPPSRTSTQVLVTPSSAGAAVEVRF